MDNSKVIDALQDLIIRLQDAEKGYNEIALATSNQAMKKWLERYAKERHNMHKNLENQVGLLGGDAEVKTSFLGDLHRMFIDIKINNVSADNEFDSIVNEIDRGASTLISDYTSVIEDVEMSENIKKVLISQRALVQAELKELINLKEEFDAVKA